MTIVRCPRCRDEVTAPAKASTKALVRCPLCLEEYLLSEALAGVPPALIVVGGEVEAETHGESGGDEYRLSGSAFSGVFDTTGSADAAAMPARPAVAGTARPRKHEKSAALELVKIVLGGFVGLAMGLVFMWWVLGRDPFEVGPRIANYAPWLVPTQFHGKSKSVDSEAAAAAKKTPKTSKPQVLEDPPLAGLGSKLDRLSTSSEPAGFNSGLLDSLPGGASGGKLPEPSFDIPLELPKPAAANVDLPPRDLPPPSTQKGSTKEAAEGKPAPPMPDLTDLLPDSTPPAELSPVESRPVPSAVTFAQAVATATDALARYEGLPKEEAEARREAFTNLYKATSEVGRVLSFLNPIDAELSEDLVRLQDLLDTISGAKGLSKLNPVKFLAAQQWQTAKQDDGLLVAGTVKEIQPAGRLFEITLNASSRSEFFVPILTTTNPEELCAVGDIVVIVGRVLGEPQKHLPGYDGQHAKVLLFGHGVRAPKTE